MTTTRTATARTVTYNAWVDGTDAAELVIDATTRMVLNIETSPAYQRQGLARLLWDTACTEAPVMHALPHHRTAEGDAFAQAVGGDTINDVDGYEPSCCVCSDVTDEDEDY